ncbi:MAG TPA: hypothetical protein VGI12_17370 [Vicinamibacterales bacterium]|jgi:hypothetical protein
MDAQDLERIARHALRELGAGESPVTVTAQAAADRWTVAVGGSEPLTLSIRAGAGTSPQFVRDQIFEQFRGQ